MRRKKLKRRKLKTLPENSVIEGKRNRERKKKKEERQIKRKIY